MTSSLRRVASRVKTRGRQILAPSRYRWDDVDTAFVVSTGRTGTEFFAAFFSDCFHGVDARHEPQPDLFDIGTAYARARIGRRKAVRRLRESRLEICGEVHRAGVHDYVESNNNLAPLTSLLRDCFPRCRIVHVVRDGRDFVRSAYSKTVLSRREEATESVFMTPDDRRRRLQAPEIPGDPYAQRWDEMSRFERLAWYWVTVDRMIADAIEGDPLAITVRFEDIFARESGVDALRRIVEFLGLDGRLSMSWSAVEARLGVKKNQTAAYRLPSWREWSEEQRASFQAIAGEHMARYGYPSGEPSEARPNGDGLIGGSGGHGQR